MPVAIESRVECSKKNGRKVKDAIPELWERRELPSSGRNASMHNQGQVQPLEYQCLLFQMAPAEWMRGPWGTETQISHTRMWRWSDLVSHRSLMTVVVQLQAPKKTPPQGYNQASTPPTLSPPGKPPLSLDSLSQKSSQPGTKAAKLGNWGNVLMSILRVGIWSKKIQICCRKRFARRTTVWLKPMFAISNTAATSLSPPLGQGLEPWNPKFKNLGRRKWTLTYTGKILCLKS